ncbi:glutaredoxin family protein [Paraferrimonas sedimenticola]|uniref:Glutaredoxin domain-containing protein n=1 Tax=Paraferrimonas sedimenticola TaxID=375674 RepID=A0AA37RV38_9GAMM|nr:glutaredoxin domain-containing protein [Paraferrimonas sedimenticola]GLP95107.1 hypothetical protein GCM10007895_04130 [Paraferrimonas sedimenticola]
MSTNAKLSIVTLLLVALLCAWKWEGLMLRLIPPPDYNAELDAKVIMYSRDFCPYCLKTKDYLKANGIAFVEMNVDHSEVAAQQMRRLNGYVTPTMLVNRQVIMGYEPEQIQAALALENPPRRPVLALW